MSIWIIVLLVAVVAMVLGPVMMLQPNAVQQSQEKLRARALELGLRVSMTSLPKQLTDTDAPSAMPVYTLPPLRRAEKVEVGMSEWLLLRAAYAHEAHFMQDWQWHGAGRAGAAEQVLLQQLLQQLPVSVHALGAAHQGVSCYWTERGGIEQLERLFPQMETLRDLRAGVVLSSI